MDRFEAMSLFITVADTKSFSKAARAKGVVQSTVSKRIASLEARLGVQLLRRTSRDLSLTEAGEAYYEVATRILGDFDAAEERIGRGKVSPTGVVRVAISAGLGRMYVIPRLHEFFGLYPDVSVDLDVSERHVNLIGDSIDLAVRIGDLSASALMVRRIGSTQVTTVAAPSYLEKFGEPATPQELEDHACVIFMFQGGPRIWTFDGPGGPFAMTPTGSIRTNDAEHIRAAVRAGLGVAHNASWLFSEDFESGAVKRILRAYDPPVMAINAVYPSGRMLPGKAKVFVDFLSKVFFDEDELRVNQSKTSDARVE
jgi:LysR family transcriptional regulator, regulator for bpeEF and oprC